MDSSKDEMIDFWYTFGNIFLFKSTFKIRDDITKVDPYGKLLNLFYYPAQQKAINTRGNKKDLENESHNHIIKILTKHYGFIVGELSISLIQLKNKDVIRVTVPIYDHQSWFIKINNRSS